MTDEWGHEITDVGHEITEMTENQILAAEEEVIADRNHLSHRISMAVASGIIRDAEEAEDLADDHDIWDAIMGGRAMDADSARRDKAQAAADEDKKAATDADRVAESAKNTPNIVGYFVGAKHLGFTSYDGALEFAEHDVQIAKDGLKRARRERTIFAEAANRRGMSVTDIAVVLGLRRETLSRMISDYRKETENDRHRNRNRHCSS